MTPRRPSFDEAMVAAAVTRALHAVADATPIAAAPLLAPDGPGRVVPLRRLDGHPRRPEVHTRRWLAAAAAVVVLAVGVPVVLQAARPDDTPDTPTAYVPPPPLVPASPPDGFPEGEQFEEVDLAGLQIEGAIMLPDGSLSRPGGDTPAVLAATVEDPTGHLTGDQVYALAQRLAAVFGGGDDHGPVTYLSDLEAGGRRGAVAVARRGASSGDANAVLSHLASGAKLLDAVPVSPDWNAFAMPLDWVPGLSATSGVRYEDGGRSVQVTTTEAELPWLDALAPLMGDFTPLPLATGAAWRWRPQGPDSALVAWRPAPGLVGTVTAQGLSDAELAQLIDSIPRPSRSPRRWVPRRPARSPAPSPAPRPVFAIELARGVPFTMPNEVERVDCLDFVVGQDRAGYQCDVTVTSELPVVFLGPVARTDDDVTVLGIFGPWVATVATDDPPRGSVATQALVPADPASLRYALITLPREPDHQALLRLAAANNVELRSERIDLDQEFPPQG
jgi:hypothetical protein